MDVLFERLRRRRFILSPQDYEDARLALRAGFGWDNTAALSRVVGAIWAHSRKEQEIVRAVLADILDEKGVQTWSLPKRGSVSESGQVVETTGTEPAQRIAEAPPTSPDVSLRQTSGGALPDIQVERSRLSGRHFVFEPQYPLSTRQIVQIWRRLRRATRTGPKTELDIEATIERSVRRAVVTEAVLIARSVNSARLLLLCDRTGSMAPFRGYVDEVTGAIAQAGRFDSLACFYYHDVPVAAYNRTTLKRLDPRDPFPILDPILDDIDAVTDGFIYADRELKQPLPLLDTLDEYLHSGTSVVIISDAGAARGRHDITRLLDTASFLRTIRARTSHIVWLNPVNVSDWKGTSAAQIARHVPMFEMTHDGMSAAVTTLRGKPTYVERPFAWSK